MEYIKKILGKILIVCIGAIGLFCCTSEEELPDSKRPKEDEKLIPIQMPITRAPNDGDVENRIVSARMIVIKGGYVRTNKVFTPSPIPIGTTVINLADSVPIGTVDFFLIVNEKTAWNLASLTVGSPYLSSNLKNKILNFSLSDPPTVNTTTNTIPMARIYEGLNIREDGTTEYGGTVLNTSNVADWGVIRLLAKLTLNLRVNFDSIVGKEPITLMKVKVDSLPTTSFLSPQIYTATSFFNKDTLNRNQAPNSYSTFDNGSLGKGFTAHFETYLPEYWVSDKNKFTYVSVLVNLSVDTSNVDTKREYKIVIGDGIRTMSNDSLYNKKVGTTPYSYYINRNNHYIYDAKIVSYQHTSEQDLVISAKVLDWDQKVNDDIDYTDHFLNVSPSDIRVTSATYTGVINIETNSKDGWTASVSGITGGTGTCNLIGSTTNQPSGQLKFNFNVLSSIGAYATITIKSEKLEKTVKVMRSN